MCEQSREIFGQLNRNVYLLSTSTKNIFRENQLDIDKSSVETELSYVSIQCAEIIKSAMDERFGDAGSWNVIVGESFDVM